MRHRGQAADRAARAGVAPPDTKLGGLYRFARALGLDEGPRHRARHPGAIGRRLFAQRAIRSRCAGRACDARELRPHDHQRSHRRRICGSGVGARALTPAATSHPERRRVPNPDPAKHQTAPREQAVTPCTAIATSREPSTAARYPLAPFGHRRLTYQPRRTLSWDLGCLGGLVIRRSLIAARRARVLRYSTKQ
jgi:hypothetical protein